VVSACQDGILRFASLMVDAPAAEDAVDKARSLPSLGVGVHLVLCTSNPAAWGLNILRDTEARRQVESTMAAQIERFLAFGLVPTHLDSHCNIHVHPAVFPSMARLARRYGIKRIRWPAGELGPSLAYAKADHNSAQPLLPQIALAGAYGTLGLALKSRAKDILMPRCYGMLHSGMMTEDYVLWLLRRLPAGLTEIYFHPSSDAQSLAEGGATPTHRSITELRTLLSPRVRQTLKEEAIVLLSADASR